MLCYHLDLPLDLISDDLIRFSLVGWPGCYTNMQCCEGVVFGAFATKRDKVAQLVRCRTSNQ